MLRRWRSDSKKGSTLRLIQTHRVDMTGCKWILTDTTVRPREVSQESKMDLERGGQTHRGDIPPKNRRKMHPIQECVKPFTTADDHQVCVSGAGSIVRLDSSGQLVPWTVRLMTGRITAPCVLGRAPGMLKTWLGQHWANMLQLGVRNARTGHACVLSFTKKKIHRVAKETVMLSLFEYHNLSPERISTKPDLGHWSPG